MASNMNHSSTLIAALVFAMPDAVTLPQHFIRNGDKADSLGKINRIGHGNNGDDPSWSVPHFKDFVVEYALKESNGGQMSREEAMFNSAYGKDRPLKSFGRGAAWEGPGFGRRGLCGRDNVAKVS